MTLSSTALKTSMTLSIFIMLILTSAFSNKNSKKTPSTRELSESHICLTSMKTLSILALTKLLLFTMGSKAPMSSSLLPWMNKTSMKSMVSMNIDSKFMFFSTVALLVTWSMMEFSIYYMHSDPFSSKFFRLLVIFLLKMLMLTAAENLFLFFVGWEGVGFLSFLLMSWWTTRTDAKSSALQAIIYKRMGDLGIMVLLSVALFKLGSWKMNKICHLKGESDQWWTSLMLFAALMGAMGKSAQFGLHPWLPAAMEGPTPVSALLHSSTMVVAGVFLLMRMTKILQPTPAFLKTTLMVGSLTAIFAATSAFHQHDMKKIIAYSTTSQLGLMMVSMGLKNPLVALFHMCTHAFFKAMLFLCSGSIIHSFNKEQDLRKMKKISQSLPMTASCLFLGSIALMGIPFLSGFYSKDLILELVMENPSNLFSFFLSSVATLLTAAYSFRMMTFCFSKNPNSAPVKPMKEEDQKLFFPLVRLAMGSIFMGWSMSLWMLDLPTLFPLSMVKKMPTTVTIMGATMASTTILFLKTKTLSKSFFSKTWFFTSTLHSTMATTANLTAFSLSTRTLDRGWKETMGGQGMFLSKKEAMKKQQLTQTGYIKQYLLSMTLLMLMTALTITIS